MKIIFDKEVLLSSMGPAMSAVSDKNTISAIEGILFTTEGQDKCILSSYDLEKGYRTTVEAEVLEEGSFIINAAKLFKMIRMMPGMSVTIEVNEKFQTKIYSGNSVFSLSALPGGDFPNLPDLYSDNGVTLKQGVLKRMIGQIQHAIGIPEQRAVLGGAFFKMNKEGLVVVSCDGNRLALRNRECALKMSEELGEELSFIVPGKTLSELSKLLNNEEEDVTLCFGRKHVIFHIENSIFFSRLIDGDYIDYERVIPKNNNIKVVLDREELVDCLERVSLVTDDKSLGQIRGYVKCVFNGNELQVSSSSSVSSVSDEMEIDKTGDDITIGFNCRYLLDALRAISDEKIKLSLATPLMSILIERAEETEEQKDENGDEEGKDSKFLYMVCPVKMKE